MAWSGNRNEEGNVSHHEFATSKFQSSILIQSRYPLISLTAIFIIPRRIRTITLKWQLSHPYKEFSRARRSCSLSKASIPLSICVTPARTAPEAHRSQIAFLLALSQIQVCVLAVTKTARTVRNLTSQRRSVNIENVLATNGKPP